MHFFFPSALNDTLLTNFPIACSDSPYFEEAAQWLYYSRAGRRGTHKADGRDNSLPSLSGPQSGGWNKRCDGEGQGAIVLWRSSMDFFSRWHPVAPDLNAKGRPRTVMGDGEPETRTGPAVPPVFMSRRAHLLGAVCSLDFYQLGVSGGGLLFFLNRIYIYI